MYEVFFPQSNRRRNRQRSTMILGAVLVLVVFTCIQLCIIISAIEVTTTSMNIVWTYGGRPMETIHMQVRRGLIV